MVPFPEVANLCEMALALNQKCRGRPSTAEDAGIFDLGSMLSHLESRVAHDHSHRGAV
jgi:hypothetical protein